MTPNDVLRELRRIRFSPWAGRPITIRWLARQSGYSWHSLYRAIRRGWVSPQMAERLSVTLSGHHNAFLGRLGAGREGRGGWAGDRRRKANRGGAGL